MGNGLPAAGEPSGLMWKIFPLGELTSWAPKADGSAWLYDDASPVPAKTVWSGATSTVPTVWESSPSFGCTEEKAGRQSRMTLPVVSALGEVGEFAVSLRTRP